ncbi:MAG: hypothetical protein P8M20_03675 [Planctomycetaceae bacterium]|nr:hypothetical protein [Planctomycetaceae bacterium]
MLEFRFRWVVFVSSLLGALDVARVANASDLVMSDGDFEQAEPGKPPVGWRVFTHGTLPQISVVAGGPGKSKSVFAVRDHCQANWSLSESRLQNRNDEL